MAETKIEWTAAADGSSGFTFNPWYGCQKASPACDHCYAESWAKRSGLVQWGPGEDRRRSSPNYWKQPIKWNRQAEADGIRRKVFCASLADVFDNAVPNDWRVDLWVLIANTPHLDWLLLTKRPQNIAKMLPGSYVEQMLGRDAPWGDGWPNVWLGCTTENQEEADRRIPHLLAVPAAVHFLSCEPLLGPVDLRNIYSGTTLTDALDGMSESNVIDAGDRMVAINPEYRHHAKIGWVICGGESGPNRRPMDLQWARSIRDQCDAADVPFFGKQYDKVRALPIDLMIRQFPEKYR